MDGYVMNISSGWTHAMKRAVGPGVKIPLNELFEQYGKKHSLEEGTEFTHWLRTVKLKNTDMWKIILKTDDIPVVQEVQNEDEESIDEVGRVDEPMGVKDMAVVDIVSLSVRKGRDVIPKIKDLNLLKYAFQEANQLSGKDSLCRLLKKRINLLQNNR